MANSGLVRIQRETLRGRAARSAARRHDKTHPRPKRAQAAGVHSCFLAARQIVTLSGAWCRAPCWPADPAAGRGCYSGARDYSFCRCQALFPARPPAPWLGLQRTVANEPDQSHRRALEATGPVPLGGVVGAGGGASGLVPIAGPRLSAPFRALPPVWGRSVTPGV